MLSCGRAASFERDLVFPALVFCMRNFIKTIIEHHKYKITVAEDVQVGE